MESPAPDAEPLAALDAKIVAALERLAQALHKALWDAAWQKELSATQAQVLLYLQALGDAGASITDLARQFGVKHATVSDAVRVLTTKGLLERRPDPNDARKVRLRLSRQGRSRASSLANWSGLLRQQVSQLAPAARVQLLSTLLELIGRLQRAGMISVARMCTTCLYFEPNRYANPVAPHHCRLMDQPLRLVELRVDCPDHRPEADTRNPLAVAGSRPVSGQRSASL